ncbi:hypothetical protein IFR05_009381 [Cadophora sp. M221]|nr:hypothetical protein IFR05_009381 [Cadophora sp. M221]
MENTNNNYGSWFYHVAATITDLENGHGGSLVEPQVQSHFESSNREEMGIQLLQKPSEQTRSDQIAVNLAVMGIQLLETAAL